MRDRIKTLLDAVDEVRRVAGGRWQGVVGPGSTVLRELFDARDSVPTYTEAEVARLRAAVERMRPVVEAAVRWHGARRRYHAAPDYHAEVAEGEYGRAADAMGEAVEAYQATEGKGHE